MRIIALLNIVLFHISLFSQDMALKVVYENSDADNIYVVMPELADVIRDMDGVKPFKIIERSSLSLGKRMSVYRKDSFYIEKLGKEATQYIHPQLVLRTYGDKIYYQAVTDGKEVRIHVLPTNSPLAWEIHMDKQKTILGQKCHYAIAEEQNRKHEIWFTTQLPFKSGPFYQNSFQDLPGLVLEYILNDHFTIKAVDILQSDGNDVIYKNFNSFKVFPPLQKSGLTAIPDKAADHVLVIDSDKVNLTKRWIKLDYHTYFKKLLGEQSD